MIKIFNTRRGFIHTPKSLVYGFSLIELLIVITIIGVLATIILNSLSASRAKAYDSQIKQQLTSFRTAAEIYFANQTPNSYNSSNNCNSGIFDDFSPANGSPGLYIAPGNLPDFVTPKCKSDGSVYAVKANLSGDEYWCIDSKGASRLIQGAIGGPVTSCP